MFSDAVLTPMDTIKQKRQLGAKTYLGTFDCARKVMANEGLQALYAGYITTILMNIPFSFIYFATYEATKNYLKIDPKKNNLFIHLSVGGLYVFLTLFLILIFSVQVQWLLLLPTLWTLSKPDFKHNLTLI